MIQELAEICNLAWLTAKRFPLPFSWAAGASSDWQIGKEWLSSDFSSHNVKLFPSITTYLRLLPAAHLHPHTKITTGSWSLLQNSHLVLLHTEPFKNILKFYHLFSHSAIWGTEVLLLPSRGTNKQRSECEKWTQNISVIKSSYIFIQPLHIHSSIFICCASKCWYNMWCCIICAKHFLK